MTRWMRITALLIALAAAGGTEAELVVWEADPWENQLSPTPLAGQVAPAITIHAARNEVECAAVNIANTGAQTIFARVAVAPDEDAPLDRTDVVLREAVAVRNRAGQLVADALPRLRRDEVLTIPPGEVRQLWVEVHSGNRPPGSYDARLRISSEAPTIELPLRLMVWDFELPERMPVAVFNWDYEIQGLPPGAMRRAWLQAMLDHGINVFHLTGSPKVICNASGELTETPDFASFYDDLIALEKPHARLFLFETWQFRAQDFTAEDGTTLPYMSDAWRRAFEQWFRLFIAYTKSRGLDYGDWAFYPFDERIDDDFLALAKLLKGLDPQVQIFTDRVADAEQVAKVEPYVDIWCPHIDWTAEQWQPGLRVMHESGKPVWFYFCGWAQKTFPPLERYRLLPWEAWEREIVGCTYWAALSRQGSAWDDFDGTNGDQGSVYEGPEGPIPSRRWEAFREGLEDYCYLHLLSQRLALTDDGPQAAHARHVLERAAGSLLETPTTSEIEAWRRRIARAIESLGSDAR